MKRYNKFINDPYFLKWIFQPDYLSEQYWLSYMESHSDEKETIVSLKKELSSLKLKNEDLSDYEKKMLLQKILKKSRSSKSVKIGLRRRNFLKYAAVAIAFLLIGNLIMYVYLFDDSQKINYTELEDYTPGDKPRLILSDGSDILLEKNSKVKYNNNNNNKIEIDNQIVDVSQDTETEVTTNQIIIPSGSRSVITLCDNTVVHLNAGSKLVYPSVFTGNKREVLLFGEALFEVDEDKKKPFIVRTAMLSVKALGTKFNVSSYADDKVIQTVLVEGKVAVKRNDASFYDKEIIMKPNQLLTYNKETKELTSRTVDTDYYTLWTDGILKFKSEEFANVIKRIERFYNVKITFENQLNDSRKISGKLYLNESKQEVFNYLSILTKLNFEKIDENNYMIK